MSLEESKCQNCDNRCDANLNNCLECSIKYVLSLSFDELRCIDDGLLIKIFEGTEMRATHGKFTEVYYCGTFEHITILATKDTDGGEWSATEKLNDTFRDINLYF